MSIYSLLKNSLVVISLVAMFWWFYMQNQPLKTPETKTKPQEYMSSITITNYDLHGYPLQKLRADYWEFIPNYGRSDLRNPYVIIYRANGNVWHLSSQNAIAWHPTIRDKITELDLINNVIIERTAENGATPTKITSQSMQYFPNKELVSSDVFVSMQQPGLIVSGYGMTGYIAQNRIELHDNISTVYQKNS